MNTTLQPGNLTVISTGSILLYFTIINNWATYYYYRLDDYHHMGRGNAYKSSNEPVLQE